MKRILYTGFFASLVVMPGFVNAQSGGNSINRTDAALKATTKTVVKKPRPIHREVSGGLKLNTDGWGVYLDRGTVKSTDKYPDQFYAVRVLQIELGERKSPQEIKRTNTLSATANDKPTPFIYGKVNNFYSLKIGYGNRKLIAGKPESGNVSIHWVYIGGLTLGLLKPYYIDVYYKDSTGSTVQESMKYSAAKEKYFLSKPDIIGSSGFSKGLGEIQINPGVQLKTALHFDFAASKHSVLAIEAGASLEYYASAVQLMATKDEKALFINAYASIQFGKRW